jgi:hypothetical protein
MPGDRLPAGLAEMAAQRVAAGTAGSVASAVWSITHGEGYRRGLSDARNGSGDRCPASAPEGYRAGYASGYRWGTSHPLPTRTSSAESGGGIR